MLTVPCYLAPSSIEGLGVFCKHDIKAGEVIWRHDPMLDMRIPAEKLDSFPPHVREFIERYAYSDMKDPSLLVLESDEGRFMNHSETPNTEFRYFEYGKAIVDIPAGTEITCDYREFEEVVTMQPSRHRVGTAVAA